MTEAQKNSIDLLATEFTNAALRRFMSITPQVWQVMDRLDDVSAAMRAEADVQLDKMMQDVRESPWLYQQYFALATMEVAQAGKREVNRILKGE